MFKRPRTDPEPWLPGIPPGKLILLPVRNFVAFPGTVFPLAVGRARSLAAVEHALVEDRPIGIILQSAAHAETPTIDQLYHVGCQADILRSVDAGPNGGKHLICRGTGRFRLVSLAQEEPFPLGEVEDIPEPEIADIASEEEVLHLRELAIQVLALMPDVPAGLPESIAGMTDPGYMADLAAAYAELPPDTRQDILETPDIHERIEKVTTHLTRRVEVLRITREIGERTRETLEGRQREAILREQLATIRHELGENNDSPAAEIAELSDAIEAAGMPAETEDFAFRELTRYERMPPASSEAAMLRNWLEVMIDLPWALPDPPVFDLARARRILDADHFGLEKVKTRILEFLAVLRLAPSGKAPILCLAGPPGVGKTSLGQSIAHALDRPFARLSLGGVHDEAEIRGHRRTYVGAMPGLVIQQVRRAGTRNCVLMLDEIDKLGHGPGGDPASALLEVLDPSQNTTFRDNYLGVDFDLSRIVFLTTANTIDDIPPPLLDRMEVLRLAGYLEHEKLEIARHHLIKTQRAATGLTARQISIGTPVLKGLIRHYTHEAGVRGLEQRIGALMRHAAMRIVEGKTDTVRIKKADLPAILGAARHENEVAMRTSLPGVATGLAWTAVGGDILFIEASRVPGKGALVLTGQLGEVMRESAQAAHTLLRMNADALGIEDAIFENSDIHVHVPAGAIPKDGPSAGVAIFAALASLLLNRKLRSDTAMTGEISLRGLVLPVGGVREKVVAAAGAGLRRVLLPDRNRHDFEEIPETARARLEIMWLKTVNEVLDHALEP